MKLIDLVGQKFGRLTVVKKDESSTPKKVYWFCVCDCGTNYRVAGADLRSGDIKSCGCLRRETKTGLKHGQASGGDFTGAYRTWAKMRERVLNKNAINYPRYGGKGIAIDPAWNDFNVFYRDMGPRPKGGSIERIDSNGNYEPSNCRWATTKEQSNNRSINMMVEWKGQTKPVGVWAEEVGIHRDILYSRIWRGWDTEKAMTQPVRGRKR